jgi:23S rRNA (cytosine1962-C5)-methyltransferase
MKIWRLKKGGDIRLRSGHPWVFSNELQDSPKGILPGEVVEVQTLSGQFMARGYGNPQSLIAFRALSFDAHVEEPESSVNVVNKLIKSWKNRYLLGFSKSFRLCFSESDFLPGLIVDRYLTDVDGKTHQIFSYQLLTAGMQKIFSNSEEIFQLLVEQTVESGYSDIDWDRTVLLTKNDVQVRKLEGLAVEPAAVVRNPHEINLSDIKIQIPSVMNSKEIIYFQVNLVDGQKTGFFLDQTHNMKLLIEALKPRLADFRAKDKPVKIVDLCCYMGQWSAQIASYLKSENIKAEITLVDVSELALQMAQKNLSVFDNVKLITKKTDVLEGLTTFPENHFDVVISDPPAFVKNKKDVETGLHGYMKLNQQAFRIANHSGIVASCTCSGIVQMSDFKNSLRKGILRSGKKAKLIAEGGLGWDHPQLIQFPEGQYLKMLLHTVE